MMQVQYHGIKEGAGLETWRGMSYRPCSRLAIIRPAT